MALWVPPARFANVQNNLVATPSGTDWGVSITGAGTANTKGAYSAGEIFSSTTYDTYLVVLGLYNTSGTNTNTSALLDIGIGASGSESTIISNLLVGWRPGVTVGGPTVFYLPIFIPAGSRVAGRVQGAQTSKVVRVAMWLYQGASQVPWRSYIGMDDYGVDTATSCGTSHTPGNTGAESAWASVGSTTSRNYDALFFLPQGLAGVDTAMLSSTQHWEIGYGSTTFCEYWEQSTTSEQTIGPVPGFPIPCSVPSGTQLQVRAEASATAEARDVAIYGLY